jgi:hypothetical protein
MAAGERWSGIGLRPTKVVLDRPCSVIGCSPNQLNRDSEGDSSWHDVTFRLGSCDVARSCERRLGGSGVQLRCR